MTQEASAGSEGESVPDAADPARGAPPSVLVAGSRLLSLAGIHGLLESRGIGRVELVQNDDTADLLRRLVGHKPDAIICDVFSQASLGAIPGSFAEARSRGVSGSLVVLTHIRDVGLAAEVIRESGCGFVSKDDDPEELLKATTAAIDGSSYVSPSVAAAIARASIGDSAEVLSEREIEVLRMIGLGYTNPEIAKRLFLSVRTVESHRSRIQEKLGVRRRHQLVEAAISRRLIGPSALGMAEAPGDHGSDQVGPG